MRFFIGILFFSFMLLAATQVHAESLMNCQNGGSATVGDLKQAVRVSCGEPEQKEVIGYIDKVQNEDRIKVMNIEEWIYSTSFYGQKYYYSLTFEGNKLVRIDKFVKK